MADVTSRLRLVVDSTGIDKAGNKLKDLRKAAMQADETARSLKNAFLGLAGVVGAAFSVGAVLKYADTWKKAENQIKTVTNSFAALKNAQEGIFQSAQKTYTSYEATANLYTAIERSSKGILKNQSDALLVTTNINKALAVGGAGKSEQQAAILQLGQALGSGRLQGDEFRSITENAPLIATAIANSMGIARGELKKFASEGKITSEVVVKAMRDIGPELDKMFASLEPTIGQSLQKLENAFTKFVGTNGAGIFSTLAKGISLLADNLDLVAKLAVIAGVAITASFASTALGNLGKIVSQMIALERALGATSAAAALQSITLKQLQGVWRSFTAAIAANPIGLIAVALAAAAVAFYEFSDSMKVAEGTFTSTSKLLNGELLSYSVSVQDVLGQIPGIMGEALAGIGAVVGTWLDSTFGQNSMKKITAFFQMALEVAVAFTNKQIGLFVGLAAAIVAAFSDFPRLLKDIFITAFNNVGRAVTDWLNELIGQINQVFKLMSYVNPALANIVIPHLDWTNVVNDAAGQGQKVIDAFNKGFNADYVGMVGDAFAGVWEKATDRAIQYKKAQAEALALQKQAGADASGYGGGTGTDLLDPKGKKAKGAIDAEMAVMADRLAQGYSSLEKSLKDLQKTEAKPFSSWLAPKVQKQSIDLINDTTAAIVALKGKQSALAGGFENYQKYIAALALQEKYGAALAMMSEADRKDAAEKLILLERQNQELDKQVQRAKDLSQYEVINRAMDSLTGASDGFWDDFVRGGKDAFSNLGNSLQNIFFDVIADGLKSAFDPVLASVKKSLSDVLAGLFNGTQKAGSDLIGATSSAAGGSSSGALSSLMSAFKTSLPIMMIAAIKPVQNVVEKAFGIKAENAWGKAGSNFGVIGTIIGNILGGGKTDATAGANLSNKGAVIGSYLGNKRTDETTGALNSAISAIQSGYDAIKQIGGTVTTYVTGLNIGQRDRSNANLSNGTRVSGAVGDAADLANNALTAVLKATDLGSASLNKIRDGLLAAGSGFDETTSILSQVKSVLDSTTPALSTWQSQLKAIKDTFEPLIAQTGAYSSALQDAYNTAKGALVKSFNEDISKQLSDIVTPLASQFSDLLKSQASRTADAKALGGNMGLVKQLNDAELQKFLAGVVSSADNLGDLTTEMNKMMAAAKAAGQDVSALSAAFTKAKTTITSTFNSQIQDSIKGYLNSPTDQLNDLLKQQAARLEEAKQVGGDVAAVERLTALELQGFFKGLSDTALSEVSDFLGLFDQATNYVVKNLDLSRQDLQGRADSFAQFAETFSQLNADITQKYIAASPRESLGLLRGNVNDLLAGVKGGNEKAAQDLPDAINKLVDAARATYGNTDGFNEILAFAQDTLSQAKTASLGVQSDAEKQIAVLDANNDILSDIRDILQSSTASNAFFQSYLSGGVASSDALLALIQQGTGMTAAANDNASALNITGLIAQSVQPIIAPLATSIDNFTQRLATMPSLQQLTIEAVDRGSDNIVSAIDRLDARLDRIETLTKKELSELEQIPKVA